VEFSQYPELLTMHQDVMDQKCAVMSTFMWMHIWLSILSLWKAHLTLVFTFCSDQVRFWKANLGTVLGHQLYLQPVTPTGHLVLIFQASSRNEANLGTIGSELKNCLIFARLSKMKLNLVPGFFFVLLNGLLFCEHMCYIEWLPSGLLVLYLLPSWQGVWGQPR
jgi:hypothetical protein